MPDTTKAPSDSPALQSAFRNWISTTGLVLAVGSFFSSVLLLVLDTIASHSNPYLGILTYMVAPGFLMMGIFLIVLGVVLRRRKTFRETGAVPPVRVDFSVPRSRKAFLWLVFGGGIFLLVSAIGSYQSYHFTESVQFCGQTCHTVMKPELITYLHGPHARVSCAECHIGKGAGWFVKSKLSGTYQVYAVAFDKYPRPVPTPIKNLRPAQDTCEQCHWPEAFTGNVEKTYNYFLSDPTNTHFSVRLLLKVGGGDPTHGPVGGIHHHMNVNREIYYFADDEERQKIPYIKVVGKGGQVTEYRTPRFTNQVDTSQLRRMDCMDCHNRPAHRYKTPTAAVNLSMSLGKIDPALPSIKSNAVYTLTQTYTNEAQALQSIAGFLNQRYPSEPRIQPAIAEVQGIYSKNFFPEMKASWSAYPDNIGHKDWPGCFRCHDGNHKSQDRKITLESSDCETCHSILSQGTGAELLQLNPQGQKFRHPDGEEVDGSCHDCHTGSL